MNAVLSFPTQATGAIPPTLIVETDTAELCQPPLTPDAGQLRERIEGLDWLIDICLSLSKGLDRWAVDANRYDQERQGLRAQLEQWH